MTKEQRDWLIKNNLDPEVYDIDAEGNVFENPIMGKLEAGARSAAASLVPAAGGFGGGAAGAAIGAPLGPLGVIAGGLIGGLSGSFGASKIQEAALEKYSPETLEKLSQAQEEQPVASYAGGFLPTALTLRPTTKGLSGLLRPAARQTTLREAISKPEFVAPASNVAINVGQAAAGQALDVSQGAEFSGPRMAADIALGTLFSRPTRLGRKLGLPDIPEDAPVQQLDLDRARFMAQPPEEFVTPREERLGVGREKVAPEQFFGTETEQRNRPISEERMAKQYADWWKSETEPTTTLIKQAADSVKVKLPRERISELANDPEVARVISDPTTLPEFVQNQYQQALEDAYDQVRQKRAMAERFLTAEERADITKMEELRAVTEEPFKAETAAVKTAQDIYDSLYTRLQRQGEGAKITQADIDAAAQIAARRNLKIELDRAFAGDREVRGMWLVNKDGDRVVRVNPLMATPDTAIHEIGHDIFSGVTNPSMRKSLLESAQDSPAYRSELAARQAEVDQGRLTQEQANNYALEEGLIQSFGEQAPSIKRSEIRSWFKAVKASTKQLFTGKISPEDAIAWLHYASTESVPWKGVAAPKATEQRFQRGEERTRKFAERVAASEEVPAEVRRTVAESPESRYEGQSVTAEAEAARTKTDRQLANDIIDPESNTRVISAMEQFNRQIASGDMEGAGTTAINIAKSGTTWGQLINQFKLLKSATPEGVIQLVSKSLEQKKRKPMTQAQVTALTDAMNQYRAASDQVTAAKRAARDAIDANNEAAIQQAAKQFDLASAVQGQADVAMNELISRINPSSAADLFVSMVQGSVMSPISIVRNVVGNIINAPLRDASDATAAAIDSALFGGKNSSYNYRARSIERLNAFAKSLPQAGKILLKGSDAMPYELGTDIGNPLNFTRAWRNLYEAMSGQYEGAPIARNIVEATLGAIPDVFLRLTQATDVPFRAAERARIITEVGRQRGLSKSQIELAKRDPKLLRITDEQAQAGRKGFTEDDLGLIEYEAAKAVFQQDNAATRMVSGINRFIKQEGGPVAYVPYRLISLFQKTPINVAAEALSFTPAGVLRNWKDMSVREREIATSRLIIGGIVTGAYAYLYDKGVITPNLDTPGETNKARELAKAGGVMPPGTLNVSGLRRLVRGENPSFQPGDTVKDLSALGTSGALGMMVGTAKRLQERSPTDDPDFLALGKGAALSGINFVMEQQFLKGTSDFIKLLSQESGSALDRFVKSLSVTAASPVAPAILGAVRRVERENLPAIGGEGFIKDTVNELNQRFAAIGLQIPGTRDPNAMPVRRDLWGEPVEQTPKSENPWIYNFFSAAKSRQIDADPLNATLYSIWRRTADNQVIPSAINPKITYKGTTFERMTPDQYDRYTQLVGFYRRKLAERAYLSGQFQQRGDEVRINLMKRAYDKGLEIGKYRFLKELRESGQSLTPQAGRRGFTAE
jgi:hypothetical protein